MAPNGSVAKRYDVQAHLRELHGAGLSWRDIAALDQFYGVSFATLRDIAVTGRIGSDTRSKLGLPPQRIRIAADVTEEQRVRLHQLAASIGITWTEMVRKIADGKMEVRTE